MNEFILASLASSRIDLGPPVVSDPSSLPPTTELVFDIDASVRSHIARSTQAFDELVGKHELHVLHYEGLGRAFARRHGVSPDAVAQMVKQLAFWRWKGRMGVVYESAQTRRFGMGRTEVIRSLSNESRAWVEAMGDPAVNVCLFFFVL
jgi:carnitine O-acetyltransferase